MFCVVLLIFCFSLNCSIIEVWFRWFCEVIFVMLVMWFRWCFRGVVMLVVMVLGLALGRLVWIKMVGRLIVGSEVIGRRKKVVILVMVRLMVKRVVVIGCWMKILEKFMGLAFWVLGRLGWSVCLWGCG